MLMKRRWPLFAALTLVLGLAVLAGCSTLDERQRAWIFQPGDRTWSGGLAAAEGMEEVWMDFKATSGAESARLHGLWLPGEQAQAPILLVRHWPSCSA